MTSCLRAYGSVPLRLLLCCSMVVVCAGVSGAGEWWLIRANYIISQQLAHILYLVKTSLRQISPICVLCRGLVLYQPFHVKDPYY